MFADDSHWVLVKENLDLSIEVTRSQNSFNHSTSRIFSPVEVYRKYGMTSFYVNVCVADEKSSYVYLIEDAV